jgi:hypothetical protein
VDTGGHPPIPLIQDVPHLGNFSTIFQVPNFQGHFEAINDVFSSIVPTMYLKEDVRLNVMCTPQLDLFYGVSSAPNIDHLEKLWPWEVDVSTNHIGDHKPFGVSYSGVRVLDV